MTQSKLNMNTAPADPKLPFLFVFCGFRGAGRCMLVWLCVVVSKRSITVCRHVWSVPLKRRMKCSRIWKHWTTRIMCVSWEHIALNNILKVVRKDRTKYDAHLLYQKEYNKYGNTTIPYAIQICLQSGKQVVCFSNQGTRTFSHCLLWMSVRGWTCIEWVEQMLWIIWLSSTDTFPH